MSCTHSMNHSTTLRSRMQLSQVIESQSPSSKAYLASSRSLPVRWRHFPMRGSMRRISLFLSPRSILRLELQEAAGSQIAVIEHVPNSSEQLALLGVTEAGDPLRLNRVLSDADLVLSIGPAQGEQSCDRLMARILPTFSDLETLGRFQSPRSGDTAGKCAVLAKESDTCDWLLGLGLALQVVPGPEGTVVRCFCGTPLAAARRSAESYREIWRHSLPKRADLVVASICGDKSQQNWNALSRALSAAEALVESKGAIALCSEIGSPLGPSLRRMLDAADLSLVEKKLRARPVRG